MKMSRIKMAVDYYGILMIPRFSDADTIRAAYHRRAYELHPDRNGASKEAEFKTCVEAFELLKDDATRRIYDEVLRGQEDIEFPYGFFSRETSRLPKLQDAIRKATRNRVYDERVTRTVSRVTAVDESHQIFVPLELIMKGGTEKTPWGDIAIPKGTYELTKFAVGDHLVSVRTRPHPRFARGGEFERTSPHDLICFATVTMEHVLSKFAQGRVVDLLGVGHVWKIHGKKADEIFRSVAYSEHSQVRIVGAGLPSPSGGRGDIVVELSIQNQLRRSLPSEPIAAIEQNLGSLK